MKKKITVTSALQIIFTVYFLNIMVVMVFVLLWFDSQSHDGYI